MVCLPPEPDGERPPFTAAPGSSSVTRSIPAARRGGFLHNLGPIGVCPAGGGPG